jgi:maltose O-acetyltransferase
VFVYRKREAEAAPVKILESWFLWVANHLPRMHSFDRGRRVVLSLAGVDIRGRARIWGPLMIRPIGGASRIAIGDGSFVNTNVHFGLGADGRVTIGRNVLIGPGTSFETSSHGLTFVPGRGRCDMTKPIVIADEAWIGIGAIVLGGVTIGRGAVVAAGALVKDDVPPGTIVGGVPARVLGVVPDASADSDTRPANRA